MLKLVSLVVVSVLTLGAASSVARSATPLVNVSVVLSRAGAQMALNAALDAAAKMHAPCSVAVVDPSGTLMAFESFDGVRAGSPDLALGKARAAALLQRPTSEIEDKTNQGRVAFVTSGVMALRGGMPLRDGNVVVGAIGVAGLNKDNDVKIAAEAADAFAHAVQGSAGDGH